MNLKMSRDTNGNKTVLVRLPGHRGFSIQTNGNLPRTHRTNIPDPGEIHAFVKQYGTLHQKRIIAYRDK